MKERKNGERRKLKNKERTKESRHKQTNTTNNKITRLRKKAGEKIKIKIDYFVVAGPILVKQEENSRYLSKQQVYK